jgi:hypothetical protein
MDAVCAGNLNLAFATVVEYIESVAKMKADREDVTGKTSCRHTESLVEQLSVLCQQQIEDSTADLNKELLAKIEDLGRTFASVKQNIESKVSRIEEEIVTLKSDLDDYSHEKQASDQSELERSSPSNFGVRKGVSSLKWRRELLRTSFERSRTEKCSRLLCPSRKPRELMETITITSPSSAK